MIDNLPYLNQYEKYCDLDALRKAKLEEDKRISQNPKMNFNQLLAELPIIPTPKVDCSKRVSIGTPGELSTPESKIIESKLKELIPWRKGPFDLFGTAVDAEWDSDLKWKRIKPFISPLNGKIVLDIGCNNGYYMFRMLEQLPKLVLGIDPMVRCKFQFDIMNFYAKRSNLKYELLGLKHLKYFSNFFHTIFSMGVLYHHHDPIGQLLDMKYAMRPKGQLILETIGIPGDGDYALFPPDTYSKMNNVWFFPTKKCLINWAQKAKFENIEIINSSLTTSDEQKLTKWCPPPYQSLDDFLDPKDRSKTVEGFPAPLRFTLIANKKK